MKLFKSILTRFGLLGLISSATLFLAGCDSGGGGGGTKTGPSAGASFAGAVISFNPTITFTSGTSFSWSNESGDNADLVVTSGAPVTGTYTYTPSSDFLTGTLTFTFSGDIDPITLNLSNFSGKKDGITAFTVGFKGASYNGTVLGTGSPLVPYVEVKIGGGGTGGGTSGNTITSGTTYNGTLEAAVDGISFGSGASSLTPEVLAVGATSFRVSSDRSKVFFNGRTVGTVGSATAPGFGGTGVYALSTSASKVTTLSVVFDGSGVAIGAIYSATALSGGGTSSKSISQNIDNVVVAP
jgi:hypothetical protein